MLRNRDQITSSIGILLLLLIYNLQSKSRSRMGSYFVHIPNHKIKSDKQLLNIQQLFFCLKGENIYVFSRCNFVIK